MKRSPPFNRAQFGSTYRLASLRLHPPELWAKSLTSDRRREPDMPLDKPPSCEWESHIRCGSEAATRPNQRRGCFNPESCRVSRWPACAMGQNQTSRRSVVH